jgi:hypothetical protein
MTARAWIFQDRPDWFDLRGAVRALKDIDWTVKRYKDQVTPGDRVYLWEAGTAGGIVAVAEVLNEVAPRPSLTTQFVKAQERLDEKVAPRVYLRVHGLIEPTLTKKEIREDPRLGGLSILRFAAGTNFAVTEEEALALDDLVASRLPPQDLRLRSGDRVRLRQLVERYPFAAVPAGATGAVVRSEQDLVSVRLDDAVDGLEEWNNELQWVDGPLGADLELIDSAGDPPVGSLIRVAAPGRRKRRLHRVEEVHRDHVVLLEMWRSNGQWVEAPAGPFEARPLGPHEIVFEVAPRDGDKATELPS